MLTKKSVTALVIQKAVLILRPLCLPNLYQGDYSGMMVSFPEASDKAAINSRGHVQMIS